MDSPALFENRPCYRLLAAGFTGSRAHGLGPGRYFDGVNVSEAIAHEFARHGSPTRP